MVITTTTDGSLYLASTLTVIVTMIMTAMVVSTSTTTAIAPVEANVAPILITPATLALTALLFATLTHNARRF